MSPVCLITGCGLADVAGGRYVHGDLFQLGHVLIFNAVLNEEGDANWEEHDPNGPPAHPARRIAYFHDGDCFEKRGVIVFSKSVCTLSDAARLYTLGRY